MAAITDSFFREQLLARRERLQSAIAATGPQPELARLVEEVDAALQRFENGTYGLCETCHDPVEKERLIADPLVCYCIDHLTSEQRRKLEDDLELAARIQRGLLPKPQAHVAGWEVRYHYEPLGLVSGDYCDLIHTENGAGDLFFLVGDVSGKGVAASMLMSQLHAMFRSLVTVGLPVERLVALANRVFCESTISGQFATLVCGRASPTGEVELCNAGHLPTLLVHKGRVTPVEATGLPLGMFCDGEYGLKKLQLQPGDSLVLYTDGVSEARDPANAEYGLERLLKFVAERHALAPPALMAACLDDLRRFSAGAQKTDDLTLMVLRRAG